MNHTSLTSSNLKSAGYDAATKTLEITFNSGQTWQYSGVAQATFDAFLASESQGKYFNAHIRTTHTAKRSGE